MQNKSKKTKKQAKRLLLLLGNWATESSHFQDAQELEETIDLSHEVFLNSPDADDYELRITVLSVHKQLKDLCVVLKKLTPELVSEIQGQVVTEHDIKALNAL